MTVQFLFWVIVAVFLGGCVTCLQVGYHMGRDDYPEPRRPGRAGELPYPPQEEEKFNAAIQEWLAAGEPWHERLADTGELRALAYSGDLAQLAAQTDIYKKEIDRA